tara:strand:+ start:274 stop:501 length:228 start_codon:yes stop_codon:yes gene_type:complete
MTFIEKMFGVIAILIFLMITGVAKANPIVDWFQAEKEKTIAFQQKGWQDAKDQTAQTKLKLQDLWNKVKDNVTQN